AGNGSGLQGGPGAIFLDNASDGNIVVGNNISDNLRDGLRLLDRSSDNIVLGNLVLRNALNGIQVDSTSISNVLKQNIAQQNGIQTGQREGDDLLDNNSPVFEGNIRLCPNTWLHNTSPSTTVAGAGAVCIH